MYYKCILSLTTSEVLRNSIRIASIIMIHVVVLEQY